MAEGIDTYDSNELAINYKVYYYWTKYEQNGMIYTKLAW